MMAEARPSKGATSSEVLLRPRRKGVASASLSIKGSLGRVRPDLDSTLGVRTSGVVVIRADPVPPEGVRRRWLRGTPVAAGRSPRRMPADDTVTSINDRGRGSAVEVEVEVEVAVGLAPG